MPARTLRPGASRDDALRIIRQARDEAAEATGPDTPGFACFVVHGPNGGVLAEYRVECRASVPSGRVVARWARNCSPIAAETLEWRVSADLARETLAMGEAA